MQNTNQNTSQIFIDTLCFFNSSTENMQAKQDFIKLINTKFEGAKFEDSSCGRYTTLSLISDGDYYPIIIANGFAEYSQNWLRNCVEGNTEFTNRQIHLARANYSTEYNNFVNSFRNSQ